MSELSSVLHPPKHAIINTNKSHMTELVDHMIRAVSHMIASLEGPGLSVWYLPKQGVGAEVKVGERAAVLDVWRYVLKSCR